MSDSFQILRPSSMRASSRLVCSSGLTSSQYFRRMIPDSTTTFSNTGTISRKRLASLLGAEPHHPLDAGSVVPAAVEDHDLPGRGQMWNVALGVHLRLLALGRRGKRDHPEDARAHPLGHGFDRAALAGAVAPFEEDADLEALVHHPLLELDELDMQPREFLLVFLSLQLAVGFRARHSWYRSSDPPFASAFIFSRFSRNCPKCVLLPGENEADIAGHAPGYSSTSALRWKPSGLR